MAARTFDLSVSIGSQDYAFSGAAAVGNLVVFAPSKADVVGVYDAVARTFDGSISTGIRTADMNCMYQKFDDAAAVGNLVVFAPSNANVVGVYDVVARTFDHSVSTGRLTVHNKFNGEAAVGNLVVLLRPATLTS
jgi:hypothetical protein